MRRYEKLSFKMGITFTVFLALMLIPSGVTIYMNQMGSYKDETLSTIRDLAEHLETMMEDDGDEYVAFQNLFMERFTEVDIPNDFDEYASYQKKYEAVLHEHHSGLTPGLDIPFEDLDNEVKDAFVAYRYVYWTVTFEKAREAFGVPYTYYIVPRSEGYKVMYLIDIVRDSRAVVLDKLKEDPNYVILYE